MPRFFFDITNGDRVHDEEGTDLAGREAVRSEVMRCLSEIAANEIPKGADRRCFTVLVSNDVGEPVYSATLTYTGLWLER